MLKFLSNCVEPPALTGHDLLQGLHVEPGRLGKAVELSHSGKVDGSQQVGHGLDELAVADLSQLEDTLADGGEHALSCGKGGGIPRAHDGQGAVDGLGKGPRDGRVDKTDLFFGKEAGHFTDDFGRAGRHLDDDGPGPDGLEHGLIPDKDP